MRRTTLLLIVFLILAAFPVSVFAQDGDIPIDQGRFDDLRVVVPGVDPAVQARGEELARQARGGFDLFPIVPCGTRGTGRCTACGFLDILENIVKFVTFGVTGPVAAVIFIYAGFLFMFASGNPTKLSNAKRILTNAIYGIVIILLAWLIVVQLIKVIAPGSAADKWYEFNCPEFLRGAGDEPEPIPTVEGLGETDLSEAEFQDICLNPAAVAGRNGNIIGEVDSPDLTTLITCLTNDPVIKEILDTENQFTYEVLDQDDPREEVCQERRGNHATERDLCGVFPCAHTGNSCHYGGRTGTNGAEAVDFNIKNTFDANGGDAWTCPEGWEALDSEGKADPNQPCKCPTGNWCGTYEEGGTYQIAPRNDNALWIELRRVGRKNKCEWKQMLYNERNPHVHVSTITCDADGAPGVRNEVGLE